VIDVRFKMLMLTLGAAATRAPKKKFRRAVVFHSAFRRSEAGGGLNALSHCAEEKAGACGKREWGGRGFKCWPQRSSAPFQRLSLLLVTTASVDGSPGVMRFMSRIKSRMVS